MLSWIICSLSVGPGVLQLKVWAVHGEAEIGRRQGKPQNAHRAETCRMSMSPLSAITCGALQLRVQLMSLDPEQPSHLGRAIYRFPSPGKSVGVIGRARSEARASISPFNMTAFGTCGSTMDGPQCCRYAAGEGSSNRQIKIKNSMKHF